MFVAERTKEVTAKEKEVKRRTNKNSAVSRTVTRFHRRDGRHQRLLRKKKKKSELRERSYEIKIFKRNYIHTERDGRREKGAAGRSTDLKEGFMKHSRQEVSQLNQVLKSKKNTEATWK